MPDGYRIPDDLALFASHLSHHRFGGEELRVLEAALSAGDDVAALLATRSAARRLLQAATGEALAPAGTAAAVAEDERRLAAADFFARAFAIVGDVESCLAMRYEVLVLRETKYCKDHDQQVSHEEWLTFAKDSLDNGFYTIASKAFANALVCIDSDHRGRFDPGNSILKNHQISDIKGYQYLAMSLTAPQSVQTQSAEYIKRKASRVNDKGNLHAQKPKLLASSMFRLGINTRNIQKLHRSQERNTYGSLQ